MGLVLAKRRVPEGSAAGADKVFEYTALVAAALPLLFAVYLSTVPAYGNRPWLLFGFVLLLDAGLFAVAVGRGQSLLHAAGAMATLRVDHGHRACGVQQRLPAPDGDGEQPGVQQQNESEQEPWTVAVGRHCAQIHSKQERQRRSHQRRVLENLIRAGSRSFRDASLRQHESHESDKREHYEDTHAQSERACVEELEDPAPLIDGGQDQRQRRQEWPRLPVSHPREADVQQHQIGEQGNRLVLPCRQQRGRGKAAQQTQHRDEERFAPEGQEHC